MIEFRMPSLGADMEAGTLVEWLIKPGEAVKRGDVVAVVETQKGAIEIEIFNAGVVAELAVPVGQRVPVGTVLARLNGGAVAAPAAQPVPTAPPLSAVVPAPPLVPVARLATARLPISPAARRLASERGIDIAQLKASGPGGAITVADVQAWQPAIAEAPRRRTGFDPVAMRQAITAAMSRSKREIPHYYLSQTVSIAAALTRLETLNRDRSPPARLLPAALMLRAAALAMAKLPELNGFWEDGRFRLGDGVHIGWAIALRGGGLVAPAIRDADRRSLEELMAAMRDLVQRARSYGLRSSELTDPTVTVTSLGDRGAETVLPIIYPPQVAMIGIGRIVTRPWVVDGAVVPRPVVTLTLAGDHRVSDGHRGGLLLAEIDRLLQEPDQL